MKKEEETKPDDLDNRIDGIGDRLEGIDKKLEVKKENNMNSQTTLITTSSQTSCQVFSFLYQFGFFLRFILRVITILIFYCTHKLHITRLFKLIF